MRLSGPKSPLDFTKKVVPSFIVIITQTIFIPLQLSVSGRKPFIILRKLTTDYHYERKSEKKLAKLKHENCLRIIFCRPYLVGKWPQNYE